MKYSPRSTALSPLQFDIHLWNSERWIEVRIIELIVLHRKVNYVVILEIMRLKLKIH